MEQQLKQRLIGAAVLGALAIIFLPMLLRGPEKPDPDTTQVPLEMPAAPTEGFETREIPLTGPIGSAPENGVLGMTPAPEDTITPLPDSSGAAAMPESAAPDTTTPPINDSGSVPTAPEPASETRSEWIAPAPADTNTGDAPVAIDAATGQPVEPAPATPAKPTRSESNSPLSVVSKPKPKPVPIVEKPAPSPTPAAAPQPAAPPPSVPGGSLAVNVGSFSNAANADELIARLRASGLPVFSQAIQIDGKAAQRIRVGPYADRATAETARLRTEQISGSPASVVANEPAGVSSVAAAKPAQAASATPAASPARAGAAPSIGFAVQLGAYRDESEALTLRDRARAAGFTAFHQRVPAEQGVIYRVRLGPEVDRPAAERLLNSASQKLGVSGIVVTHP